MYGGARAPMLSLGGRGLPMMSRDSTQAPSGVTYARSVDGVRGLRGLHGALHGQHGQALLDAWRKRDEALPMRSAENASPMRPLCSSASVLALSIACVVATIIVSAAIYVTGQRLQPALSASVPVMTNAGTLLDRMQAMEGGAVSALIENSVSAATHAIPAVERAAIMLNQTSSLIERMNQLLKRPSLRIDLAPDAALV